MGNAQRWGRRERKWGVLEKCSDKVPYEYTVDSHLLLVSFCIFSYPPPFWSVVKLSSVDRSVVRFRLGTTGLQNYWEFWIEGLRMACLPGFCCMFVSWDRILEDVSNVVGHGKVSFSTVVSTLKAASNKTDCKSWNAEFWVPILACFFWLYRVSLVKHSSCCFDILIKKLLQSVFLLLHHILKREH